MRNGWVHTGDLGVFDTDGFLSIVGRQREVIRSGGESVFPAEIERVLLTHPRRGAPPSRRRKELLRSLRIKY